MTTELPKIDVPTYTVKIPSTGKEITVRPFTVKEQKLLLLAVESKNIDEQINAVKQVINNCIVSGTFDVNKAPFFDVDFLYVFLHAKSIGPTVDLNITCHNKLEDGNVCNHTFPTKLDLSDYELIKDDTVSDTIKLDGTKGIKMKYPSYLASKKIDDADFHDKKTVLIINSIDNIWDKKTIHPSTDYTSRQLKEFVESLTEENYKKLENFVDNFPTCVAKIETDCPKCGFHHVVRYADFQDFFY